MSTLTDVKLKTVNYVILYTRDWEKATAFYRDVLGMTVKTAEHGWVELDAGTLTLALHGTDQPITQNNNVVVFGVENIKGAYETLESRGVKFNGEIHEVCGDETHVGLSADFRDLDGNLLSIFEYVKK